MKFLGQSTSPSLHHLHKNFSTTPIPHPNLQLSPLPYAVFSPHHPRSKPMAACVDCRRPNTAKKAIYLDPNRPQIDNSRCKYGEFDRRGSRSSSSGYATFATCAPTSQFDVGPTQTSYADLNGKEEDMWKKICDEARSDMDEEPILGNYYYSTILCHNSLESALANHLSSKLSAANLPSNVLFDVFLSVMNEDGQMKEAMREDLRAAKERDPACISFIHCLLHFKGFLACQAHRVSHKLWNNGRRILALLIQNRASEVFSVDIHPGAKIGRGILFDHATGVVIGETAVIGDNVSILHNVTLGGTGKVSGDRHPKIGNGVLVGAGTHILGNVMIGEGAKIGAGSVVLKEVPPRTTAVGNPAKLVGGKENPMKLDKLPSFTMDHTSFINEWSDYVI